MSWSTTALSLGGTTAPTTPPVGILPAAPTGVAAYFDLQWNNWTQNAKNLVNYPNSGLALGTTTLQEGYVTFPGTGGNYLDSLLAEQREIGILALIRSSAVGTTRRVISNYGAGMANGLTLSIDSSERLMFGVDVESTTSVQIGTPLEAADYTNWTVVAAKSTLTTKRIRNMTLGTGTNSGLVSTRLVRSPGTLIIGANQASSPSAPGPIDIFGVCIVLGRCPTDEEENANAAQMVARAAAAGISTTLAAA